VARTLDILNEISVVLELVVAQLYLLMPLFDFVGDFVNFSFVIFEIIAFKIYSFLLMFDHAKENECLNFLF